MMSKVFLALVLCCAVTPGLTQQSIKAEEGVLDARNINLLDKNQNLPLNGKWEFYWEEFLTSNDFVKRNQKPKYLEVPSIWNDKYRLKGQGYATYRLIVLTGETPQLLSIDMPNVYTSYKLFINGKLIAKNGKVGASKFTTSPQWKPTLKVFEASDTLEIICQVSNFSHKRGGIHKQFTIGSFENISFVREQKVVANMILAGGLFALGAFFISFYFLRKKEVAALFFGLFCLFWALRSVFSNIYLISYFFESINWNFSLRVEYLSLYISVLFGTLFMSRAFDKRENQLVKYIIVIINFILMALTIVLPPILFTELLPAYQFFIAVNLLFAIYIITRALFEKQTDAWFAAISVILGVCIFGYELINYVLVLKINVVFLNLAYLSIFFCNALVLAKRFVRAIDTVESPEKSGAGLRPITIRGKRLNT